MYPRIDKAIPKLNNTFMFHQDPPQSAFTQVQCHEKLQ